MVALLVAFAVSYALIRGAEEWWYHGGSSPLRLADRVAPRPPRGPRVRSGPVKVRHAGSARTLTRPPATASAARLTARHVRQAGAVRHGWVRGWAEGRARAEHWRGRWRADPLPHSELSGMAAPAGKEARRGVDDGGVQTAAAGSDAVPFPAEPRHPDPASGPAPASSADPEPPAAAATGEEDTMPQTETGVSYESDLSVLDQLVDEAGQEQDAAQAELARAEAHLASLELIGAGISLVSPAANERLSAQIDAAQQQVDAAQQRVAAADVELAASTDARDTFVSDQGQVHETVNAASGTHAETDYYKR